jgi:hypothetical protein
VELAAALVRLLALAFPGRMRSMSPGTDQSHVDVADLDLALPHNAAGLDDDAYDIAAQARAAWVAAVCWDLSGTGQFAVKRLVTTPGQVVTSPRTVKW